MHARRFLQLYASETDFAQFEKGIVRCQAQEQTQVRESKVAYRCRGCGPKSIWFPATWRGCGWLTAAQMEAPNPDVDKTRICDQEVKSVIDMTNGKRQYKHTLMYDKMIG